MDRCVFELDWTQEQFFDEAYLNWQLGRIKQPPWELPAWLMAGIGHVGRIRSMLNPDK